MRVSHASSNTYTTALASSCGRRRVRVSHASSNTYTTALASSCGRRRVRVSHAASLNPINSCLAPLVPPTAG